MDILPLIIVPICFGIISWVFIQNQAFLYRKKHYSSGLYGFVAGAISSGVIVGLLVGLIPVLPYFSLLTSGFVGAVLLHCHRCHREKNTARSAPMHWNDKEVIVAGSATSIISILLYTILSMFKLSTATTLLNVLNWSFIIVFLFHVLLGVFLYSSRQETVFETLMFVILLSFCHLTSLNPRTLSFIPGIIQFYKEISLIFTIPFTVDYETCKLLGGVSARLFFRVATALGVFVGIMYH